MKAELTIRPGRPGDRLDMERICAHTWESGDYIPGVWADWLADERGLVVVGEVGDRMIALSKITFQPHDQVWLEGMRVEPDYRRQGIASQFLDYSLCYAWERGARVVRLGTSSKNTAVHIMVGRAGMERVATYALWVAEPLPSGRHPLRLSPDRAAEAQAFVRQSEILAHTRGLYSRGWSWQELARKQLARHLSEGQVMADLTPGGGLAALAVVAHEPGDQVMWIGFADGRLAALAGLAAAIRVEAAQTSAQRVQVMVPDIAWLRDALQAAGFGFGDWEGELWIFERWLAQDGAFGPTTQQRGDSNDG
jgi:GNAT superfamily N-acetyltransferase